MILDDKNLKYIILVIILNILTLFLSFFSTLKVVTSNKTSTLQGYFEKVVGALNLRSEKRKKNVI